MELNHCEIYLVLKNKEKQLKPVIKREGQKLRNKNGLEKTY